MRSLSSSMLTPYASSSPSFSLFQGIRDVPKKLRIVIERKRNEEDEEGQAMYSLVTLADNQERSGKGVVVLEA